MKEVRIIMAVCILLMSTYTDIKEKNIYVVPIMVIGLVGLLLNIFSSFSFNNENYIRDLIVEVIIPLAISCLLAFFAWVTNEAIGMGDVYLIGALMVVIGILPGMMICFLAVIICGIYSFTCILAFSYKKEDYIPFAPFLTVGYLGYICIEAFI